jgi:DNA-binding PadR family transcriptional regulator
MATPVRSTVNVAVLSVVLDTPSHGYDVCARFEDRFQGLFRSSAPHVYRSLGALEHAGHVRAAELPEAQGRGLTPLELRRKCFWLTTPQGARTVTTWLGASIPPDDARRELWIRLRAVRPGDHAAMLGLLDRYEEAILRSVGYVRALPEATLIEELAREDHEAFVEAQLRWLPGAREKLRERAARESDLP